MIKNNDFEKQRFVAMLDVMGTKSLIKSGKGQDVYQLFDIIRHEKTEFLDDSVSINMHSDSFLLYTTDNSMNSYQDIIFTSARLVEFFLKNGFGVNGCIAHGECFCSFRENEHITIGQPFVDAHLFQEDLFFYGVVLHDSALKIVNQQRYSCDISSIIIHTVVDLKIPSKNNGWCTKYMVNWMEFLDIGNPDLTEQMIKVKKIIKNLYEKYFNAGRGAIYVQNTELVMKQWYDRIKEQYNDCDWGNMLYESYLTKCP